jgi:Putative DNA-binding domain
MTTPPPWFVALQAEFSAFLKSPLDSATGTFRSAQERYSPELLAHFAPDVRGQLPLAQLSLYHEQVWMRFFTVMQSRYPRVASAMGYWHFNQLALLHLTQSPPTHFDIDRCGDHFGRAILNVLEPGSRERVTRHGWWAALERSMAPSPLIEQAARMDEAERNAFLAPQEARWAPTPEELAQLPERRIQFSRGCSLVTEQWDLIQRSSLASATDHQVPERPPVRLPETRHWVFYRTPDGVGTQRVSAEFSRLLRLCREQPFGAALAALEADSNARQLKTLQQELSKWVKLALERCFWVGIES